MENQMFCYQCQETAKGTGCTLKGVCGKAATTSAAMDLLLAVSRGVGIVSDALNRAGAAKDEKEIGHFLCDALFCTITNANFDDADILQRVEKGIALRDRLVKLADENGVTLPERAELRWDGSKASYAEEAKRQGVLRIVNEDIRSLKELTVYGLKGMAAYYEHASNLQQADFTLIHFMAEALAVVADPEADQATLVDLVLRTGQAGVKAMALLDKANTSAYGSPVITKVNLGVGRNPGILISGHDLHDLEDLLKQTEGMGIDIYTHGEMLPAHYYPQLKKYAHLVGNYGNAWWQQKEEFARFNGPIIFTTNCIVPPRPDANYKDRVFTLNST
ncbi:MAG: hydroxylamine reductase, partial [Alloprevotella tannerae]|nr:hydroxylamine reductase [Alloprevotella tannerae]